MGYSKKPDVINYVSDTTPIKMEPPGGTKSQGDYINVPEEVKSGLQGISAGGTSNGTKENTRGY